MGKIDMDECKSVRCCCQLISKCQKTPATVTPKPERNGCGARAERPELSICDFLKLQPIPEWINVNDDSKDMQHAGPCRVAAALPVSSNDGKNLTSYAHRSQPPSECLRSRSSEQIGVPMTDGGADHYRKQQRPLTAGDQEDRRSSQIVINFGTVHLTTVVTGEMGKRRQ